MKPENRKYLFYAFVFVNIVLLLYISINNVILLTDGAIYFNNEQVDLVAIKHFLNEKNFLIAYFSYILILIIRGLTLIPGTIFLFAGIYIFSIIQVFFAIQVAIVCYCLIIYHFSHQLNFKIPDKILSYEQKIKNKEIPIIFLLCFIPGISINVLVYFLSIINIQFKSILIGIISGTAITSFFYILLLKGVFESIHYFPDLLDFFGF